MGRRVEDGGTVCVWAGGCEWEGWVPTVYNVRADFCNSWSEFWPVIPLELSRGAPQIWQLLW
eukprot:scaffold102031_cov67-Phaeocystis_antarctica.AAC.2